jgi:hypothetical protein
MIYEVTSSENISQESYIVLKSLWRTEKYTALKTQAHSLSPELYATKIPYIITKYVKYTNIVYDNGLHLL